MALFALCTSSVARLNNTAVIVMEKHTLTKHTPRPNTITPRASMRVNNTDLGTFCSASESMVSQHIIHIEWQQRHNTHTVATTGTRLPYLLYSQPLIDLHDHPCHLQPLGYAVNKMFNMAKML